MADAPKLILGDDWKKRDEEPKAAPAPAAAAPSGLSVDSDWKNQAAAERDRLAADEAKKANAAGAAEAIPEPNFGMLVSMLTTQALQYLGAFPDPETGRPIVAPPYAKLHIDLLTVLEEKTRGNLTPEEAKEIAEILTELRLRYVEISKAIAKVMAEKAAKGAAGGAIGAGPGGLGGISAAPAVNLKFPGR